MKFNRISLFILSITIVCFAFSFINSIEINKINGNDVVEKGGTTRVSLAIPKLFDFERFKNIFKKRYGTIMEELARKRIFLGNAIRAFLSFVGYKNYKTNSYLKVTELSDWTLDELRKIFKRNPLTKNINQKFIDQSKFDPKNTPVADMKDIEEKLNELSKEEEFANELNKIKSQKMIQRESGDKNNNEALDTNVRSTLTLDNIVGDKVEQEKTSEPIPSDNPNNQKLEVNHSNADNNDIVRKQMGEETSSLIVNLPGTKYLSNLISNVFSSKKHKHSSKEKNQKNTLPDIVYVDHRQCFPDVIKNQGDCGSCYIFATTALYEWRYCQETGEKVAFSEQYVLDCSGGRYKKPLACNGGSEDDVATFFGMYGLELSSKYWNRQRTDICPYDPQTDSNAMGYIRILSDKKGELLAINRPFIQKYLPNFPMIQGVLVNALDFSNYGGGVDDNRACLSESGHSMTLVGSGREDGEEYWLYRNSFGPYWGDEGYYKMNKKAEDCLMDDGIGYFLQPRDGEETVFETKPNPYNDPKFVKKRYEDVMNGIDIPENPYCLEEKDGEHSVVAPST